MLMKEDIGTESSCAEIVIKIHYDMDISHVQTSEMRKSSNNYSSKKQSNEFKVNKIKVCCYWYCV